MGPENLSAVLDANRDKNIRAVFPVHLAGRPADPEGLSAVARGAGIGIVEDACHALGSRYQTADGQVSVGGCRDADMAIFSFHPVKTIASGEGGMVTTNSDSLAARLRSLRSHGMIRNEDEMQLRDRAFDPDGTLNPWYYEMPEIGFNLRLSDIHAALGASQLGKLEKFAARHRALAAVYDELLEPLAPEIVPVRNRQGTDPVQHLYQVLIDFPALQTTRATLMNALRANGIGTQVHYIPVHTQPYYQQACGNIDLPEAEAFYQRCLSLPFYPAMKDEDVVRVVDSLRRVMRDGGV